MPTPIKSLYNYTNLSTNLHLLQLQIQWPSSVTNISPMLSHHLDTPMNERWSTVNMKEYIFGIKATCQSSSSSKSTSQAKIIKHHFMSYPRHHISIQDRDKCITSIKVTKISMQINSLMLEYKAHCIGNNPCKVIIILLIWDSLSCTSNWTNLN